MPSDAVSLLRKAHDFVREKCGSAFKPEWAVLLGSGLDPVVREARVTASFSYSEVPGFPAASVTGHAGRFIACEFFGKSAIVFSGRAHYYEGHSPESIIFPIRLASFLGCKNLILTAATGGINSKLKTGDIVVVQDHLNFMGINPLRGPHDVSFGERFPDMSSVYSEKFRKIALATARKLKIRAASGIYAAVSGPSYETPAEIRAFKKLGGDVVGMSVVPEAIVGRQMNMEILALAYVSNMAAGISKMPLSHEDVLAEGKRTAQKVSALIKGFFQNTK